MKKSLLSLFALIPIFSAGSALASFQKLGNFSSEKVNLIEENINMIPTSNQDQQSNMEGKDEFLNLKGQYYDWTHRIYIDSSGDTSLPYIEKVKDAKNTVKSKKDLWNEMKVEGLFLDVTKYAKDKSDFLKKYRAVTVTYLYMYNFWNSKDQWTYVNGKSAPFNIAPYTISLDDGEQEIQIFEHSDSKHSYNERARLTLKQCWEGDILKINFVLAVWYFWKGGSIYNHATIAALKNDLYTLVEVPEYNPNRNNVNIGYVNQPGSFKLDSVNPSVVQGLDKVDQDLKDQAASSAIKNAWFKNSTIVVQYFYGEKTIDKKRYAVTAALRWDQKTTKINLDCSLLLNGANITRTLTSIITNSVQTFYYENSYGHKESTNSTFFPSEYLDIELKGEFKTSFFYLD